MGGVNDDDQNIEKSVVEKLHELRFSKENNISEDNNVNQSEGVQGPSQMLSDEDNILEVNTDRLGEIPGPVVDMDANVCDNSGSEASVDDALVKNVSTTGSNSATKINGNDMSSHGATPASSGVLPKTKKGKKGKKGKSPTRQTTMDDFSTPVSGTGREAVSGGSGEQAPVIGVVRDLSSPDESSAPLKKHKPVVNENNSEIN